MKVGIYASVIASERGHENNVSGHIQVPVQTVRLLQDAGHEVHLITNHFGEDHTLPACLPDGVNLHTVDDGKKRPKNLRGEMPIKGIRPGALLRQVQQIKRVAKSQRLDVLHLFGNVGTAQLGGMLRLAGLRTPVVATLVGAKEHALRKLPSRVLLRRLNAVVTSTQHVADTCSRCGLSAHVIRHGILRDFIQELEGQPVKARHRILYWRDANKENGIDLCMEAFETLAGEFPDVSFDFAIRPSPSEVPGLENFAARTPNIQIHRFPYPPGISLAMLINESLVVVLPFRSLTINPQFAIAESLKAGVPVVTTRLQSNPELVQDWETGRLVAVGESQPIVQAIREMLGDRQRLEEMRRQTSSRFSEKWNWDRYIEGLLDTYRSVIS
jgi:glycosyltransferase involved in cell wall biosynthesis